MGRSLQVLYTSLSEKQYATVANFPQPGIAGLTRFLVREDR